VATQYRCNNPQRAIKVQQHPSLNGVDYVTVLDQEYYAIVPLQNLAEDLRQRTLLVYCIKAIPLLTRDNVRVEGGVRVKGVEVVWAHRADSIPAGLLEPNEPGYFTSLPDKDKVLVIRTDSSGDFSSYTLRLVDSSASDKPPNNFDLQLSEVKFSFKVECASDFDCAPVEECPSEPLEEPQIDYLAKDYDSFRQLLLDRFSVLMPDWKEQNPADVLVTLTELLAYQGDQLSYFQDAVATEAYLGTALHRTSVKRHARLLDYPMHEGRNARAWVALEVITDGKYLPANSLLLSRTSFSEGAIPFAAADATAKKELLEKALSEGAVAFETLKGQGDVKAEDKGVRLYKAHNEIHFYTWGDENCCLPKGATRATLNNKAKTLGHLTIGDVLIFEEVRGASGYEVDADPALRHVLRLNKVTFGNDPLENIDIVEIEWHPADALPFPLCLAEVIDPYDGTLLHPRSVVLGNVVLADHGYTSIEPKTLPAVPQQGVYRPVLEAAALTQVGMMRSRNDLVLVDKEAPAAAATDLAMGHVRPAIQLLEQGSEDRPWLAQSDLLDSGRFAREFVVEVGEHESRLRFGDDILGAMPEVGVKFQALYREGNGLAGNVGRDSLVSVLLPVPALPETMDAGDVVSVRNPLPAQGGSDPEPMEQVKLYAPQAFRRQERAVTAEDYAAVTECHLEVQKAAATIRWTGSWYTVFITIDRTGGRRVDAVFEQQIRDFLERYRMAGHDLEVNAPMAVPLDLKLEVCVKPGYYRSDVKAALLEAFSSRDLVQGKGFFYPDNFTFGTPVYLSQIYSTSMQVAGVQSVAVERFQRLGKAPNNELKNAELRVGRLEIVRLDNDPNFPENGKLELVMKGVL
jgi:hypothetical protein